MCEVLKIRDVSLQFGVSARTLRYYEDMGLINSIRSQEYAYRLYDEKSISRLEQILVLRKLNISIKDIKMLFASSDSDTLLKILMKKVTDIDEEVSVLHEMKKLVIEFIEQVKKIDINNRENIVKIYDKLMRLEHQIEEVLITDFPVEK